MLAKHRQYDAILLEREVFHNDTWDMERRLRAATKRLVLDVDDGIFLNFPEKFDRIAEMCDACIGGNQNIVDYLKPRCKATIWIPTCIRLADYSLNPAASSSSSVPVVGWIGTPHNVAFLKQAAAGIRAAARQVAFRLLVVSSTDQWLPRDELTGVDIEFRKWDPDRDVADLQEMDIGLMPLPDDDPWMKYKCGLKLIQYLAVGVPGLASPIGVNADILADNRVGRACHTPDDWEQGLLELLRDAELRRQLGAAGRQLVEEQFTIERHWRTVEQALIG